MSICPASGFFIESTPDDDQDHGNFEVVVSARDSAGGLLHYWRDNAADGYPWTGPSRFGQRRYEGVSLCESDFKTHDGNDQYNLEVIARFDRKLSPLVQSFAGLDQGWRENGGDWRWHGPTGTKISGGIANPSVVAERNRPSTSTPTHEIGDIMAVILRPGGGFDFCRRDQPNFDWRVFSTIPGPRLQGAGFLLSYVHSGTVRGDAGAGDKVVAAVAEDGTLQLYCRRAMGLDTWSGPLSMGRDILQGAVGNVFAGRPSIIMSDFDEYDPDDWVPAVTAHYGNYELVAPLKNGGIAHFWKDNGPVYGTIWNDLGDNEIVNGWHGYQTFGTKRYTEVSIIQSNLGEGDNGHLEIVARSATQSGFDFYWRDDDLVTWHGPQVIA